MRSELGSGWMCENTYHEVVDQVHLFFVYQELSIDSNVKKLNLKGAVDPIRNDPHTMKIQITQDPIAESTVILQ